MAKVLRAWDGRLQREVAIKLIRDRSGMPGMQERFLREARVVSGLTHPNICTIFDIGEQDGELYLVMELLEGETLRERIAAGPLPIEETVRYAKEVAEALALAHSRGVVHRDIKPANIFLVNQANGRKQAKVLDFGLAKRAWEGVEDSLGLTETGTAVGTVFYMSPEQARGEELDARTDLFALGVVLYEMATGELPFRGSTTALVFVELLREEAPPVRARNAAIPKTLERVIQRLLEKRPEDRFQSAEELGLALEQLGGERQEGWFPKKAKPTGGAPLREPATRPKYPPRQAAAAQVKAVWDEPDESRVIRAARAMRTPRTAEERARELEAIAAELGAGRRAGMAAAARSVAAPVVARPPGGSGPVGNGAARQDVVPEQEAAQVRSDVPWDVDEVWDEDLYGEEDRDDHEELAAGGGRGGWLVAAALLAAVAAGVAAWLGGWFSRAV
jgi:serine/threonine-protein kinase